MQAPPLEQRTASGRFLDRDLITETPIRHELLTTWRKNACSLQNRRVELEYVRTNDAQNCQLVRNCLQFYPSPVNSSHFPGLDYSHYRNFSQILLNYLARTLIVRRQSRCLYF